MIEYRFILVLMQYATKNEITLDPSMALFLNWYQATSLYQ